MQKLLCLCWICVLTCCSLRAYLIPMASAQPTTNSHSIKRHLIRETDAGWSARHTSWTTLVDASSTTCRVIHDDVIKWKTFSALLTLCAGIHRWPVNSPHKGQWRGALMLSLICALNKRLSKQSRSWWFETPVRSSWRHCNEFTCNWPNNCEIN